MISKPTTISDEPTNELPQNSTESRQLSPNHANTDSDAKTRQGIRLPGYVYGSALKPATMGPPDAEHFAFVDAIQRMAPREPAEEMLVAELVAVHGRVLRLNILANGTTNLKELRIINELTMGSADTGVIEPRLLTAASHTISRRLLPFRTSLATATRCRGRQTDDPPHHIRSASAQRQDPYSPPLGAFGRDGQRH